MSRITTSNNLTLLLVAALGASCSRADVSPAADTSSKTLPGPPGAETARTPTPVAAPDSLAAHVPADSHQFWEGGVGPIRLGMTLDEVRHVFPRAIYERDSDGDGAALVTVSFRPDSGVLSLYAGEADPDSTIDWSRAIEHIESFSQSFHTAENVHPGSLVSDVERIYGKTKWIMLSEIESRQFIAFENHPRGLDFRIDGSGVFTGDSRTTTVFRPEAKILSISVSR